MITVTRVKALFGRPWARALAAVLLWWGAAAAADVQFVVTPDRTRIAMGESVVVTATLVSPKNLGNLAPPPVAPSEDFSVVRSGGNSSSSSSINIVNGQMTRSTQVTYYFQYVVAPKKTGRFTFPALQVSADGQTYSTQPFAVDVGSQPVSNPDVLVVLACSKKQLFAGEQSLITVKVCHKPNASIQLTNEGFGGFMQSIEKALGGSFSLASLTRGRIGGSQEQIEGELYMVYKVQYALFAMNPGTFTIPPLPLEYNAIKRTRGRFVDPFGMFNDDFFGGGVQAEPKTVLSKPLTFSVKSLPPPPAGFSGAVGSFTLKASADPRTVPAGEAVTYTLTLAGNTRPGNLGDITLPQLQDFEVFTPEKRTDVDTTASGIAARKTQKYLVIPQREGQLTLPSVSWTYFSPETESYQTLRTESFSLTVTKGKEGVKQQTRHLTQEDIQELGRDIRYIQTPAKLRAQVRQPYKSPLLWVLYLLPFFISLASVLYKVQSQRTDKDSALMRRRKAFAAASRRLGALQKGLDKRAEQELLGGVSEVLEQYLTQKFGFAAAGKTKDEMVAALDEQGIDPESLAGLTRHLDDLDTFRFGGGSGISKSELLKRTVDLLRTLEVKARRGVRA